MKKNFLTAFSALFLLLVCGCATSRLPSEDIEVLSKHADIISVLRSPELLPNSREKYEAAKELVKKVDLHFTRETATVDKLFFHRDAAVDNPGSDDPTFTFTYQWKDHVLRIRFFTFKMFVTRVEITEK